MDKPETIIDYFRAKKRSNSLSSIDSTGSVDRDAGPSDATAMPLRRSLSIDSGKNSEGPPKDDKMWHRLMWTISGC